ncbi:MAG: hypothetical protein ACJ764_03230 [Solirubrobacteraceae bacterium]
MTALKYRDLPERHSNPFRRKSDVGGNLSRMNLRNWIPAGGCALAATLVAGCGSSGGAGHQARTAQASTTPSTAAASSSKPATTTTRATAGALSAEANSADRGDIPDNQVFLVFTNQRAGYAMKYPEGWTKNGSGRKVTFADKNNLVRVVVATGTPPTIASVNQDLQALKHSKPSLTFTPARSIQLPTGSAVAATYTTQSAPNPVTGKRVILVVDRYELARGGKVAIVDLGTPKGVDNVDAFRMMIRSFRWA